MEVNKKEVNKIEEYVDLIGGNENEGELFDSEAYFEIITPPGCWGAMITPSIKSGHEVSKPVYFKDAKPGDALCIHIEKIEVLSKYAASGTGKKIEGRYLNDPTINAYCPKCGTKNPKTYISNTGLNSIYCSVCKSEITPQVISHGYTMAFDENKSFSVTLGKEDSLKVADLVKDGIEVPPSGSKQHLATILGKHDLQNVISRVIPMIGNIGCVPIKKIPSSRNAGDMLGSLVKIEEYSNITKDDLTDGHLDINSVREGSTVIAPVKVNGGGLYIGDVHSIQGAGEIAGHTSDVTAVVRVKVEVLKNINISSPLVIPNYEDVNFRFKPFTKNEIALLKEFSKGFNNMSLENQLPLQVVGSGNNLNDGLNNALENAANLLNLSVNEIKNRATISGEMGIGRSSGLVYLTLSLPVSMIEKLGILKYYSPID